MSHSIPTGPAVVRHESKVLPAKVRVSRRLAETRLVITAPECRFGRATYGVWVQMPRKEVPQKKVVSKYCGHMMSGESLTAEVPTDWPDLLVSLRLASFTVDRQAFAGLTDDELIEALSHELEDVREAAFLAIQRPRKR